MATTDRPLRADAERNRRRILDAAREVFATSGTDVGVDDIARAAGVGIGTLYRRFPTKDDLLAAVVADRFDVLLERIGEATATDDPWGAFAGAVEAVAEVVGRDRALVDIINTRPSLHAVSAPDKRRLLAALTPILERAQAAGVVRADVVVADLPLVAAAASRLPAWRLERQPGLWRRYVDIVLDGLRAEGASPLRHGPPR